MAHPELITPALLDLFHRADELTRRGAAQASLAVWSELLSAAYQPGVRATRLFLATAHMCRAWAWMELGAHADARRCLESDVVRPYVGQLDAATRFDYWFSCGSAAGVLGDIDAMDDAFARALSVAARELGDRERCERAWQILLHHAQRVGAWRYLERECETAMHFADNVHLPALGWSARWYRAQALRALGRTRKARREAGALLSMARRAGAHEAAYHIQSFQAQL